MGPWSCWPSKGAVSTCDGAGSVHHFLQYPSFLGIQVAVPGLMQSVSMLSPVHLWKFKRVFINLPNLPNLARIRGTVGLSWWLHHCAGSWTDLQSYACLEHEVFDSLLHHQPIDEDGFVDPQPSSSKVNTQFLGFTVVEVKIDKSAGETQHPRLTLFHSNLRYSSISSFKMKI